MIGRILGSAAHLPFLLSATDLRLWRTKLRDGNELGSKVSEFTPQITHSLQPHPLPPSATKPYYCRLAFVAWTIHFAKREYETLFVHIFSNATMPLRNIFKNSGYYWGMCLLIAYSMNRPQYTPPDATYVSVIQL